MKTFNDAIKWAGGRPADLARKLGVKRQTVNSWKKAGKLPHMRWLQIELMMLKESINQKE